MVSQADYEVMVGGMVGGKGGEVEIGIDESVMKEGNALYEEVRRSGRICDLSDVI